MIVSFSRKTVLGLTLAIGLLSIGIAVVSRDSSDTSPYIQVVRASLSEEVSVTGRVVPSQSVELSFEKSGRIESLPVRVGTVVPAGAVLAVLEHSDLAAELVQARANLTRAVARYDELVRGVRAEDIAVAQARVDAAKDTVASAERTLRDAYTSAFTTVDDLVRSKADPLFSNGDSSTPHLNLTTTDSQLAVDLESLRLRLRNALFTWSPESAHLSLELAVTFFDKLGVAVTSAQSGGAFSQSALESHRSSISAARVSLAATFSQVVSKEAALSSARSALVSAEKELLLKKAPLTEESLRQERAEVERVRGVVQAVSAQLSRTSIRAPFAGVVHNLSGKVGEIASPGNSVVSLASSGFMIEAFVPEADIAKLSIGDTARVTLDAYGSDELFAATVTEIDPSETLTEGVATYKVKFVFAKEDARIKSGMTANVDIVTEVRTDALVVPSRVIVSRTDGKYVQLRAENDEVIERKIETGVRSPDGLVEVLAGLSAGEELLASPEE